MTTPPLKPRKPQQAPTPADLAERDRFAALAEGSLSAARANAESWRNGLAAFVTLVTATAIIKGRDTTADLPVGWRVAVTVLIGSGIALSVAGLWQALAAQAGTREGTVTLADIHSRHASVAAYQVALADVAATRLKRGRTIVAAALSCFLLGIATTWWAPEASPDPAGYVTILHDGTANCGSLQSAANGEIRLRVAGAQNPVVVSMKKITNLLVVTHC
jgi:hypothetical protein